MPLASDFNKVIDLSVITPTSQRPGFLVHCLKQFQLQELHGLLCEQIVVSDGPDAHAKSICQRFAVRYLELPEAHDDYGSTARDYGVQHALGDAVCFWDDDNWYDPHALKTLFDAVQGADIGLVRTQHRLRKRPGFVTIPRQFNGIFLNGDVDTMCVCVKTELARHETWVDGSIEINSDYRWLKRLMKHEPVIRYVPTVIGIHV